jgi:hypothetical protein
VTPIKTVSQVGTEIKICEHCDLNNGFSITFWDAVSWEKHKEEHDKNPNTTQVILINDPIDTFDLFED